MHGYAQWGDVLNDKELKKATIESVGFWWGGGNISPDSVTFDKLANFYNKAQRSNVVLSPDEAQIRDTFFKSGKITKDDTGAYSGSSDPLDLIYISQLRAASERSDTAVHEVNHGMYHFVPAYNSDVNQYFSSLKPEFRDKLTEIVNTYESAKGVPDGHVIDPFQSLVRQPKPLSPTEFASYFSDLKMLSSSRGLENSLESPQFAEIQNNLRNMMPEELRQLYEAKEDSNTKLRWDLENRFNEITY